VRTPEVQVPPRRLRRRCRSGSSRHRERRLLSCGSPGLRRLRTIRRAVWVELSLFAVAPVFRCSALRCFESPVERPTRRSTAHAFPVLRRHCRVSPQPPVSRLQRPFPGRGPSFRIGTSAQASDRRPPDTWPESQSTGAAPRHPQGRPTEAGRTRRGPKRRSQPDRKDPNWTAQASPHDRSRGCSLPGLLPTGDGKPSSALEETRGGELAMSDTQARRLQSETFAASLRPDLPKKVMSS
jgi:hypothetical protein